MRVFCSKRESQAFLGQEAKNFLEASKAMNESQKNLEPISINQWPKGMMANPHNRICLSFSDVRINRRYKTPETSVHNLLGFEGKKKTTFLKKGRTFLETSVRFPLEF
jgi:hypothetical protein